MSKDIKDSTISAATTSTPSTSAGFPSSTVSTSYASYMRPMLLSAGLGAWTSMIATITTQPAFNTKIFQQTTAIPLTTFRAFQTLYQQGKLFAGLNTSITKQAISGGIFSPIVLFSDRALTPEFTRDNPLTSAFYKAFISSAARAGLNPFELALTQQVSNDVSPKELMGKLKECKTPKERFELLFRGSLAEGSKNFFNMLITFGAKDLIVNARKTFDSDNPDSAQSAKLSTTDAIFAGLFAGTLRTAITYPLDTIAKVQQSKIDTECSVKDAFDILTKRARESRTSLLKTVYSGVLSKGLASAINTAALVLTLTMVGEVEKMLDSRGDSDKSSGRGGSDY